MARLLFILAAALFLVDISYSQPFHCLFPTSYYSNNPFEEVSDYDYAIYLPYKNFTIGDLKFSFCETFSLGDQDNVTIGHQTLGIFGTKWDAYHAVSVNQIGTERRISFGGGPLCNNGFDANPVPKAGAVQFGKCAPEAKEPIIEDIASTGIFACNPQVRMKYAGSCPPGKQTTCLIRDSVTGRNFTFPASVYGKEINGVKYQVSLCNSFPCNGRFSQACVLYNATQKEFRLGLGHESTNSLSGGLNTVTFKANKDKGDGCASGRRAIAKLTCDESVSAMILDNVEETSPCTFTYHLRSAAACPTCQIPDPSKPGRYFTFSTSILQKVDGDHTYKISVCEPFLCNGTLTNFCQRHMPTNTDKHLGLGIQTAFASSGSLTKLNYFANGDRTGCPSPRRAEAVFTCDFSLDKYKVEFDKVTEPSPCVYVFHLRAAHACPNLESGPTPTPSPSPSPIPTPTPSPLVSKGTVINFNFNGMLGDCAPKKK